MRWIMKVTLAALTASTLLGVGSRGRAAEDFRVENQIFLPGEAEPASRSTTIFFEGVVYDYLEGYPEVTVLDKDAKAFTFLDTGRRLRSELTTSEVRMLSERLGNLAASSSDPFIQFLGHPKFDEVYDAVSGQLQLQGEWLEYRLLTARAPSPEVAQQYRRFMDLSAQLKTALNPGSHPPQPRMLVNAALERLELIPREVSRVTTSKRGLGGKTVTARSEHQFGMSLSEADVNRVKQTREYMSIFTRVSFEEYQQHAQ